MPGEPASFDDDNPSGKPSPVCSVCGHVDCTCGSGG
jgi:hypothetical protein